MAYVGTKSCFSTSSRRNAVLSEGKNNRRADVSNRVPSRKTLRNRLQIAALSDDNLRTVVYEGMYGPWSVDDTDIAEVYGYRIGISVSAVGLLMGAVSMVAGIPTPKELLNAECVAAAAGLGVSLFLIHIYVTEIKRVIQALWALGTAGGLWLMTTQPDALPVFVADHNWSALLVGPLFAAVTAVAIKEGLCYGKTEAAILALVTPLWMGGHLTGLLSNDVETVLAAAFTVTYLVFAARKYTQAIKDDIGDKSVFEFRKLSEEQQMDVLRRMQNPEN